MVPGVLAYPANQEKEENPVPLQVGVVEMEVTEALVKVAPEAPPEVMEQPEDVGAMERPGEEARMVQKWKSFSLPFIHHSILEKS